MDCGRVYLEIKFIIVCRYLSCCTWMKTKGLFGCWMVITLGYLEILYFYTVYTEGMMIVECASERVRWEDARGWRVSNFYILYNQLNVSFDMLDYAEGDQSKVELHIYS